MTMKMRKMMRHGSLFSGIGGFDLAAQWMGWTNVFHCEWEDFPRKVLNHHFPKSISYGDIKETDFTIHRGHIDVLSGGFPCQPYSVAGKREGKNDDRHLWPEMLRAIREIKPRYVVGENVRGLLSWNGGLVFDEVQTDLENEGFEVIPFILPAASVNAPHKRDRVWFVAHANDKGGRGELGDIPKANGEVSQRNEDTEPSNANQSDVTDWDSFPSQPPVLCGDDGIRRELDGITFPKWRKESIKGYGNAIVPQVVYPIFKAIERLD